MEEQRIAFVALLPRRGRSDDAALSTGGAALLDLTPFCSAFSSFFLREIEHLGYDFFTFRICFMHFHTTDN